MPNTAHTSAPAYQFRGFRSPRYTQVPNDLFDELLAPGVLTEAELRVLLYIMRHTFGFGKDIDAISLSQFLDGVLKKDGTWLDRGCGLGRAAVVRGIKGLEAKGIITVKRARSHRHGDETNTYSLRWIEDDVSREYSKDTGGRNGVSRGYSKDTGGVSQEDAGSIRTEQLGDSERDPQNTQQTNDKTMDLIEPLPPSSPPPPYSPVIAGAVLDLARVLHDDLAGPGAVQDALQLWQRSGVSEATFVTALQAAQGKNRRLAAVLAALARQLLGGAP